jgi:hypothetical protein
VTAKPGDFPDRVLLRAFEGGAVYTAERAGEFLVIEDEGTMADFLDEEDLADADLVRVWAFTSLADREAFIVERGWRPASVPRPSSHGSSTAPGDLSPRGTTHETASGRIERSRKPRACPSCRHTPVATILYGLPVFGPQLREALEAGAMTIGGCCVSDDDAAWECTKCGCRIHRRNWHGGAPSCER